MMEYTIDDILDLSHQHPIIAFDGVCNLCNGFIQWLIARDRKEKFRYTTLQSQSGTVLSGEIPSHQDTVILAHQGQIYTLSDVALRSMSILGGRWKVLSWLYLVPKRFRDMIYSWIARNRLRWFGERDACMIPNAREKKLFL